MEKQTKELIGYVSGIVIKGAKGAKGSKKSKNYVDVINGSSLSANRSSILSCSFSRSALTVGVKEDIKMVRPNASNAVWLMS